MKEPLKVSKKEKQVIEKALAHWEAQNTIDADKRAQLLEEVKVRPFNWQSLALYSFIFAAFCLIIALVSIFADEFLIKLIDSFLVIGYFTKFAFFVLLTLLFGYLDTRQSKESTQKYSKQIYSLLAATTMAIAAGFFVFLVSMEEKSGPIILLLSLIYALGAIKFDNKLYWVFGIAAVVIGFGALTDQWGSRDNFFLGMNFPMRFTIFGALILALAEACKKWTVANPFYAITHLVGLTIFFVSLWILSISGNFGSFDAWMDIHQFELLGWSFVLLGASGAAIYFGVQKESSLWKNFGITFIFLNLYTRYFEYLWDSLHKAVFFAILAASFWLIGKKAESIWDKGN
jgi:preprotein translocase subunit YajC